MKKQKIKIKNNLVDIANLLRACDCIDQAIWIEEKIKLINSRGASEFQYKKTLNAIDKIIAGMGSLSDLPLVPKKESNMSEQQARTLQWELLESLSENIERALQ